MPIFQILVLKGRSRKEIKGLIADVTEAAVKNLSVKPEQVRVLVTEMERSHWGAGGLPINELRNQKD
ncbi:tautomerase family protein [Siminovitchia sp. 179-K 8D1 HS]|uniref:tautomerase family protein n=1 Tax=Siminovitchia sp. 179-K 8D1 HS TaxID=3142385 RepID=UPI0039A32BCE